MSDIPTFDVKRFVGPPDTWVVHSRQIVGMSKPRKPKNPPKKQTLLGARVSALRAERGITQAEAADAIGISRPYLAGIESGGDYPGRDTLVAIATFYQVGTDSILFADAPVAAPPDGDKFANDEDEFAWLQFWRSLDDAGKDMVTRILNVRRVRSGSP